MTREEIAQILKKIRTAAGLTQSQAANAIGRKQQTLASWETGQSQPDANTLFILCALYGVSVDEAFGFKEKKNAQNFNKSDFSQEACEVAYAYDLAPQKDKDMIRLILGMTEVVDSPRTDDEQEKELA